MSQDNKPASPAGIGTPTILTLMLSVLMAMFSASAMARAQSDMALSRKMADAGMAYYAACSQAADSYQAFVADRSRESCEIKLPITGQTYLTASFSRDADGKARVSVWHVLSDPEQPPDYITVWDGSSG